MQGHGRHRRGRQGRGRQILQPALLLMMHIEPAHGYELMERLKEFEMGDIDPSLIYRALHALEREELISSTWDEKDSQGPPRRVYALTEQGHRMLKNYLEDLKATRGRIDQLLNAYERHMREGTGDFHDE